MVLGIMTNCLQSRQALLCRIRVPVPVRPARPTPRQPPAALDAMRQFYETTTLTTRAIAARTGASAATVSRQARANGWVRPAPGA